MPNLENLLEELLLARGPGGQEDEVRMICQRELAPLCDEVMVDRAGNVRGVIRGAGSPDPETAIRVMAHLDEIAMMVRKVRSDGTLEVVALGGAEPICFGVCPVEILGDTGCLPGVLSYGSMHNSGCTPSGRDVLAGNVQWQYVHVVTRCSSAELEAQGVRPGSRVVLARHWRRPFNVKDCVAAHFLDDRAPMAAVLLAARQLGKRRAELAQDVWFVFTTLEEESNAGAMYAASRVPGDTTLAVEVGPVLEEYGTQLSADPIINVGDQKDYYTRSVVNALIAASRRAGYEPQVALLVDFASDASAVMSQGTVARAGCLAIPTENTHGFEMVLYEGIKACAATLTEFLLQPPVDAV
ncbi:Aminopeptidase YpdE [Pseudomonas fluorescens]|uniref:M28 family peptidase n=1 Tax=Pseudomonas fluorescens TaxID=294 RepID=UPI00125AC0FB|nr:M28 family peptidase [Pseudomonas fluorescens]CAG8863679.1 Aminopeptidase YpdE [Pseudomonas fluorescens]VVP70515.1 Aminopeptidase YpdE [Pseudomonas fluorescens]